MNALLVSVLVASVLGSLHCAAMCGGFVFAVSAAGRPLASQVAWHAGRGFAYALLGLGAGALGQGLEHTLAPAGLGRAAAVVAGALLLVWGVGALLVELGVRAGAQARVSPLAHPIGVALRAVVDWPRPARGAAMGALTALLPCGWLWAFVATAGGTGHAVAGATVMLVFWAGTLPMFTLLGVAAGRALVPLRERLPLLTASAMIVVGLLTVAGRLRPHDPSEHALHGGMEHRMAPAARTHGTHEYVGR